MTKNKFKQLLNEVYESLAELTSSKGEEYSRDDDQLANFNRAATEAGVTRKQAWLVFFNKHVDSIKTYISREAKSSPISTSEPIIGRIDDAILYLVLLRAMIIEDREPRPGEIVWQDADGQKLGVTKAIPDKDRVRLVDWNGDAVANWKEGDPVPDGYMAIRLVNCPMLSSHDPKPFLFKL